MLKLKWPSSHLKRILSQCLGFLFVVSTTIFANWVWQQYTEKVELEDALVEEKQIFIGILRKVIEETDYNYSPGIGDSKCPFKLEAHHELLVATLRDTLPKNTTNLVREIVRLGGLCNGGRTGRRVTPASVKVKSLALRETLQKIVDSETLPIAN